MKRKSIFKVLSVGLASELVLESHVNDHNIKYVLQWLELFQINPQFEELRRSGNSWVVMHATNRFHFIENNDYMEITIDS